MKLVVDANILFSALIKSGKTAELLFNLSFDLYSPEIILTEFKKHKEEILRKTNRTSKDFDEIFDIFMELIKLAPNFDIKNYINEAEKISPDINDSMYFALALKLNCPIWSNDKKLKEQNRVKVYSTENLINLNKK